MGDPLRAFLERHVRTFNAAVESGDFVPLVELFAPDARLEFVGVPVGPLEGRGAIAAAYAAQPPTDTMTILDTAVEPDGTVVESFSWSSDGGERSGEMRLVVDAGADPAPRRLVRLSRVRLGTSVGRRSRAAPLATQLPMFRSSSRRRFRRSYSSHSAEDRLTASPGGRRSACRPRGATACATAPRPTAASGSDCPAVPELEADARLEVLGTAAARSSHDGSERRRTRSCPRRTRTRRPPSSLTPGTSRYQRSSTRARYGSPIVLSFHFDPFQAGADLRR